MISLGRHRLCPLRLHTGAPTGAPTGVPLQPPLGFHWGYHWALRCTKRESERVWYFVFGMLAPSGKWFTSTLLSGICVGGCSRMFCVGVLLVAIGCFAMGVLVPALGCVVVVFPGASRCCFVVWELFLVSSHRRRLIVYAQVQVTPSLKNRWP